MKKAGGPQEKQSGGYQHCEPGQSTCRKEERRDDSKRWKWAAERRDTIQHQSPIRGERKRNTRCGRRVEAFHDMVVPATKLHTQHRDILNGSFICPGGRIMASSAVSFAKENQQRFLGELKDLLRIPSVSTAPEHKDDVRRAAEFVANDLRRIGMENVEVIPTKNHPLVYGDWLHAPGKPTVLCYAHYDVQPPDPLNEWHTPPF